MATMLSKFGQSLHRKVEQLNVLEAKLFDGDAQMFMRSVASSSVYGEYGVGLSTQWVYDNTKAKIHAVDTSTTWVERVSAGKESSRFVAIAVDVGPLGDWGYPISYSLRHNFRQYTDEIWRRPEKPDLVLVDGRFRVASFLTSLTEGAPGTVLIFDDYTHRLHYHVVEEFVKPKETCGRQALFEIPRSFDHKAARSLLEQFRLVRE